MTPLSNATRQKRRNPSRRNAGLVGMRMLTAIAIFLCGCKETPAPKPENEGRYPQPKSYAVSLDTAKPLAWPEPTRISSAPANFGFDKFPVNLFDSLGALPFPVPPSDTTIDWAKLPVTDFYLDSCPEVSMVFKTSIIPPPEILKASKPTVKNNQGEIVFDFGGILSESVNRMCKSRDGSTWIAQGQRISRYDGENIARYNIPGHTSQVYFMIEDHSGIIWLATALNGIIAIDLKRGISHQLSEAEGLATNFAANITEDSQHRIWISSLPNDYSVPTEREGGTVQVLDPVINKMKLITRGLSKNSVVGITEDKAGQYWIGTVNGGVNILDPKTNKIRVMKVSEGLASKTVFNIVEDRTGRIFLSGGDGTVTLINAAKTIATRYRYAQGFGRVFTMSAIADRHNNFWIGGAEGIRMIDSSGKLYKHYNRANGLNSVSGGNVIEDSRHQILMGNSGGLNMIRKNNLSVRLVNHTKVSTMVEDSHGRVWVGGLEDGIQVIDPVAGTMKKYNSANGLSNNEIQFMLEFNGNLLVSTTKGGIEVIDTSLKKIERIGPAQGITDRNITAIQPDDNNHIWISGMGYGIDIIDVENKLVRKLGPDQGLMDSSIIDLKKDSRGRIWFYSCTKGIGIIDQQQKTVQHFKRSKFPSVNGQVEDNLLMHDSRGNTWFANGGNGVLMFNASTDSVVHFSNANGLLHNQVRFLKERNGDIYVGTKLGISVLRQVGQGNEKKWDIHSFGKSNGIVKAVASYNSDLVLRNGDYWWGDDGITILGNHAKASEDFKLPATYITGIEILGRNQVINSAPARASGGTDTILTADSFYLARKNQVLTAGSNVDGLRWDSVSGPYNMPVNLTIPYNKNYLQFHFAQMTVGSQDTTWYRYFFEGVDKNWSAMTSSGMSENYPNIGPGKYSFKVTSLYNGSWSEPVSLDFTILPPWWQTWWAYLLYSLIIVGCLRAFVAYRSRALQRENKILEEKVNLRTEQLQKSIEELKATQAQLVQSEKMASLGELTAGIAHEIQNPLNFVNNFAEINRELLTDMMTELKSGNYNEVQELAANLISNEEKISHHGQRADAIVKSMLQHSRGSGAVSKEATDLNKLADEYFRLAYHGLRAKDKSFNATLNTDFDSSIGKVEVMPNDFGRVILNLITNAFYAVAEKKKSTEENYQPTVTIGSKLVKDKAVITVADNGNGIPPHVLDKIFQPFFTTKPTGQGTGLGLSLAYDIVKAHGGELKVETKQNIGTSFIIQLPVLTNQPVQMA